MSRRLSVGRVHRAHDHHTDGTTTQTAALDPRPQLTSRPTPPPKVQIEQVQIEEQVGQIEELVAVATRLRRRR